MGRIVALDIGAVRVGVAVSDPSGVFATPVGVLQSEGPWLAALGGIIGEYGASVLLVGMPRRTDGTDGPEAGAMRVKIKKIAERYPDIEIVEWDERFTTTIATQALLEGDVSRKDRKSRVDKIAATVLLQSYLDTKKSEPVNRTAAPAPLPPTGDERKRGRKKRDSAYD